MNQPIMTGMKAMAHSHLWWSHLDKDIENHVHAWLEKRRFGIYRRKDSYNGIRIYSSSLEKRQFGI